MYGGGDIKAPPEEVYGAINYDVFESRVAQVIVVLELMVIPLRPGTQPRPLRHGSHSRR